MAKVSKEKRLADTIGNSLDTLDFNYPHAVFSFETQGSAVHANLFELILTFLNRWAQQYADGEVQPRERMYRICQMSHRMVQSISGGK